MFAKKKQPAIRSLIAHGSVIQGHFTFSDGLRIDGNVCGDVVANSEHPSILVVSQTASVTGEIRADHVIVNGRVTGPIHANTLVEVQPKARIEGDVYYKALEMHLGAVIQGRLVALEGDAEKPTLKLAANNG